MAGKTNEQIEKIKQFFKGLTVADGNFYLLVVLPKGWKVIDGESLINNYGVYTVRKPEGTYFMTEMENGTDCLFAAVDEVIDMNKEIEERQQLLQVKAKELTDLFITEPLEKLKTLEFTFKPQIKQVKAKQSKRGLGLGEVIEGPREKVEEMIGEDLLKAAKAIGPKKGKSNKKDKIQEKQKAPTTEETKQSAEIVQKQQENNDSDTMSFIKGLVENE